MLCSYMAINSISQTPQIQAQQIPQAQQSPQVQMQQTPQNNVNIANMDLFKKKESEVANPKMQGKAPHVGVVDAPNIPKTPTSNIHQKREKEKKPLKIKEKKQKADSSIKLDILAALACLAGLGIAIFKKAKLK